MSFGCVSGVHLLRLRSRYLAVRRSDPRDGAGLHGCSRGGGGGTAGVAADAAASVTAGRGPAAVRGPVRAGEPSGVRGVEGQEREDLYVRRRGGVPVRVVQGHSPPRRLEQGCLG
ncbi:hypothetical protein GQ55_2G462100 [Panicum hallii var. hallii]|uniref:Uncharacterized protein n=1 Tax=Panicum hallii var. hallii TaxID=1504633 RepID=A0A2T7EZM8_9POAL|nr:hypothetical protein GQ55_2G462100 [Panicum hallii var. hallii]